MVLNVMEVEQRLGINFYDRQPLVIERGSGNLVWDDQDRQYLDFTSGWGVTCLGHAHPVIIRALTEQAEKIIQNPNSGFAYCPARAKLLLQLEKILPQGLHRLFFASSGAEANDAAIKLARKITGRSRVVSALGSFHGRTFNTLKVSVGPANAERFLPQHATTQFIPFGNTAALQEAINAETAALILEPVQGEGGVRIATGEYLETAASLCRQSGTMLIIDEIQTGFCRTGKFFAIEHCNSQISPDFLTMGKGIAGGFPFAAFAINERISARIEKGDHGGTYCGNPLGSAIACAVVEALQELDVAARVTKSGAQLLAGLKQLQGQFPELIREVRGLGLLTALDLGEDSLVKYVANACLEAGLIITPTRNGILRLIPGLLVDEREIEQALEILQQVFSHCWTQVAAAS